MRRLAVLMALLLLLGTAEADTMWIMCNGFVNVRAKPSGTVSGYLDAGDSFETDGKTKDGFIRVKGVGEAGDGWAHQGYVVSEPPERVDARYVCVAKHRAALRRWIGGPRSGWLNNGYNVTVYWMTSEWAVTNKGYIRSEWLEPDPE